MVQVSHPKVAATLVDAAGDAVMGGTLSVSGNRTDALPAALYVSTNGVWQPVFTPTARADGNDGSYMVSAGLYVWNGATWDKFPVATTIGSWSKAIVAAPGLWNGATFKNSASASLMANGANGDQFGVVTPANYNGTTHDKNYNNVEGTALSSAARTADVNGSDIVNYNARGVVLHIITSAPGAAPVVVFNVQIKDPLTATYTTILASAAVSTATTVILTVYPGCVAVANSVANLPLGRTWRVQADHTGTDSLTYGVGYSYIV